MTSVMPSALLVATVLLFPDVFCAITDLSPRAGFLDHDNETVCFERLGCIVTTDDWYNLKRPVNLTPSSREKIGTVFKLFTRDNIEGEKLVVDENGNVTSSIYSSDKDTKFIIHGFMGKAKADWVVEIAHSLLTRMDINVITVDWSSGANTLYTQAVANTRVVGLEIAYLINTLIERKGGSADRFHLIGHSLGAHIAGYAGEKVDGMGRITGLDPAGPLFTSMPTFVRLDPSDAKFVDVIHTDAGTIGYGNDEALGDVDFFPNGGYRQPGCSVPDIPLMVVTEGLLDAMGELPSCSHSRSEQLFLESITSSPFLDDNNEKGNNKCPFIAFLCESYDDFLNGNCVSCGQDGMQCALMGIDADKYPGKDKPFTTPRKFYLKTNALAPYCGYHYAMNLTVATESKGRERVSGDLSITAFGDTGVAKEMDMTENGARTMTKGESYPFLGFSSVNTGQVSSAEVAWKWNAKLIGKDVCLFCEKDLFVSKIEIADLGYYPGDKFKKSASCSKEKVTAIKSGSSSFYSFRC